ncbi:hypothetical protein KIH39_15220 [Telmatocola sphagniphila]|uniref:Uncharacterized protein n=1 Tax=Telmatocola sphagniphila TaxID=1123043 RepID=A0A8E6EW50_9BACT|nr:hypothetical protein [Telmatocola sphagniphila]QVL30203.1 hypothetical protein KIH39_15220 [Telmatocola sphagniphila]
MSRPIGILAVALALVLSASSSGQVLKEPPLEKLEDDDLNKPYYREVQSWVRIEKINMFWVCTYDCFD